MYSKPLKTTFSDKIYKKNFTGDLSKSQRIFAFLNDMKCFRQLTGHAWSGPSFSNQVDGGNSPLMFPKHWGPNWPTNSCVMSKSSPLRGFWGVPFCLFWQLISARMPGLCARAQNFWAQGGLTIHPKHPWENSPNLWLWCFKLVPLFWQAVLTM